MRKVLTMVVLTMVIAGCNTVNTVKDIFVGPTETATATVTTTPVATATPTATPFYNDGEVIGVLLKFNGGFIITQENGNTIAVQVSLKDTPTPIVATATAIGTIIPFAVIEAAAKAAIEVELGYLDIDQIN